MSPVLIIAEAGVNHNGSLELAKQLIDVAVEAKADIVKFQTFKADRMVSRSAKKAAYQQANTSHGESQMDMLRKLEVSEEDHIALIEYCKFKRIKFLSTPFDMESIALLRKLGITTGKIPSGEITNLPYLKEMASSFETLILSTGMSDMSEIASALDLILNTGFKKENLTVLHCNTEYPTPFDDVNLNAMNTIGRKFDVKVGYSDHTKGIEVPVAAVALGAVIIEKHFTLDRSLPGPDHPVSLEPAELKQMVSAIRNIEMALGDGIKKPSPSETKNIAIARKSIHLKADVSEGTVLQEHHLIMKRPGDGISPMKLMELVGRKTKKAFRAEHKLSEDDLI